MTFIRIDDAVSVEVTTEKVATERRFDGGELVHLEEVVEKQTITVTQINGQETTIEINTTKGESV